MRERDLSEIFKNRLTWCLETHEILSESQFDCRRKCSPLVVALADLDAQIYEAHVEGASLFSVFFDIENASLRVWTDLICNILQQI